ncbi:hypothetical protein CAPTEDRAFT_93223 [Capitella teleta]|uniref:G-protein coupled receptors family 2 profile 2 domain-containing protein n=1 Tax=Capitella teleta TaxID=283909 RepID=X2BBW7_CAPTE|nr:hypothetical protein CAPTEDRAFT_93223 [Capitella teleta]|eukprot:ELU10073.1 hypothetical protein CAPTEDRAFT_93223 [Capitella teleta]
MFTDAGQLYCNSTWDTVSCWPTTPAGQLAVLTCPPRFEEVLLDPNGNATRMCYPNGTWQFRSDYDHCKPITMVNKEEDIHNFITRVIYYVGFTTSIVALIVALCIFLYFRSLRCLRNTIHCHLIVTFIFKYILWLIMNNVLPKLTDDDHNEIHQWVCKIIVALYNYIQVANFFWMLVEGLYLHTMIVWAFSIERIRFWYYAVLGWCGPALVVLAWAIVKAKFENRRCWLPMENSSYDYIYITPILGVLLVNVIFLGSIVWVLITKLRASNTLQARQYRKAVRATLILFPLLGVTYVVFISPPNDGALAKRAFVYFNAILQSLQGLAIAVFYCFLNGEVRSTIRGRVSRWQEGRSIATRYTRASIATNAEQISLRASFTRDNTCNGQTSSSLGKTLFKNNNLDAQQQHSNGKTSPNRSSSPGSNGDGPQPMQTVPILMVDEEQL